MNTLEILTGIFRTVFDNDTLQLRPETTAHEVEGWDSLSHVNLMLAIETAFRIRFSSREMLSFRNVGELLACIESKV